MTLEADLAISITVVIDIITVITIITSVVIIGVITRPDLASMSLKRGLRHGQNKSSSTYDDYYIVLIVILLQRELRGSRGVGVVSNNWFNRVLLPILYIFEPSC